MKWITGVVKFRNVLIHECKLILPSNTIENGIEEISREYQRLSIPGGETYAVYTDDGNVSSIQLSSDRMCVSNNCTTPR